MKNLKLITLIMIAGLYVNTSARAQTNLQNSVVNDEQNSNSGQIKEIRVEPVSDFSIPEIKADAVNDSNQVKEIKLEPIDNSQWNQSQPVNGEIKKEDNLVKDPNH